MDQREELWELVKTIPRGKVSTYGAMGAALRYPASGFLVGRMMAHCPQGVPWWRVVAKSGFLPVGKLDPYTEMEQRKLLEQEGVRFTEDIVDMASHLWEPD